MATTTKVYKIQIEGTNQFLTLDTAIDSTVSSGKALKAELKALKSAMLGLEGKEFQAAAKRAAQLSDEIGDINQQVKILADDSFKLKGFLSITEGIMTGFQGAQAAMNLFGVENEDLLASMQQLQNVMAIINTVQGINNMLQKESTISLFLKNTLLKQTAASTTLNTTATVANTVATEAQTVATTQTTIAQRALNAVMSVNPIILMITAVGGLIAVWSQYGDKIKEVMGISVDKKLTPEQQLQRSVETGKQQAFFAALTEKAVNKSLAQVREEIKGLQEKNNLKIKELEIENQKLENGNKTEATLRRQMAIAKQIKDLNQANLDIETKINKLQTEGAPFVPGVSQGQVGSRNPYGLGSNSGQFMRDLNAQGLQAYYTPTQTKLGPFDIFNVPGGSLRDINADITTKYLEKYIKDSTLGEEKKTKILALLKDAIENKNLEVLKQLQLEFEFYSNTADANIKFTNDAYTKLLNEGKRLKERSEFLEDSRLGTPESRGQAKRDIAENAAQTRIAQQRFEEAEKWGIIYGNIANKIGLVTNEIDTNQKSTLKSQELSTEELKKQLDLYSQISAKNLEAVENAKLMEDPLTGVRRGQAVFKNPARRKIYRGYDQNVVQYEEELRFDSQQDWVTTPPDRGNVQDQAEYLEWLQDVFKEYDNLIKKEKELQKANDDTIKGLADAQQAANADLDRQANMARFGEEDEVAFKIKEDRLFREITIKETKDNFDRRIAIENAYGRDSSKIQGDKLRYEQVILEQEMDLVRKRSVTQNYTIEEQKKIAELYVQIQQNALNRQLNDITQFNQKVDLALAITNEIIQYANQIAQLAIENQQSIIERQIEDLEDKIAKIDDLIAANEARMAESLARQNDLEAGLDEARGLRREKLLEGIAQEARAREKFAKDNQKLEEEKLKKEEEQAKKRREIEKLSAQATLVQASAQAALSVGAIAAQSAKQDFTFGIATVASIGAVLASVTAAIVAAKQLSQFAKGGINKYQDGGIIDGPSHAEGGVKAINPNGRMIEMEGNELIVNKGIWKRPDFVKAISKMNAKTGGKDFYAAGGINDTSNINQMLQGSNLQYLLMSNLQKPIYTSVVDISKAQTRVNKIKEITSFTNL